MRIKTTLLIYILLIPNLIYLILIITLGYYNRLAADDFIIINNANSNSTLNNAVSQYFNWQGTFFITWFEHLVLFLLQDLKTMVVFTLITIAALIHSVYLVFSNTLNSIFPEIRLLENERKTKQFILLCSILFCNCFFYMSHDLGQSSWFLVSGVTRYLWPVILLLYCISFLTSARMNMKYKIIWSSLLLFIYGFSTPNYVAITIFLYGIYILYEILKNISANQKFALNKYSSLYIPLIFLVLGFIIMVIAPGNYKRRELYEFGANFIDVANITLSSVIYFIKVIIKDKLIYGIAFTLSFILIGKFISAQLNLKNIRSVFIIPGIFLALIIITVIINSVIMALAMGWAGPHRTFTLITLLMALFFVVSGIYLGAYLWKHKPLMAQILFISGIILISVINLNLLAEQLPIASKYAGSFDKRLEYVNHLILDSNNNNKTILLEPLAASGILPTAELAKDSTEGFLSALNKAYERAYGLKFKVFVRENK